MDASDFSLVAWERKSLAEQARHLAPGCHVVNAFNLHHAQVWLMTPPAFDGRPLPIPFAVDDGKETARQLITDLGCDPLDAGKRQTVHMLKEMSQSGIRLAGGIGIPSGCGASVWCDADEFLDCAASDWCEHASEEALMRLTATSFATMDGVIQGPGAPDEDRSGGFGQGGWMVPYADDDMGEIIGARFAAAEAFLLGRRTYELFAAHWPHVPDDNPVARALNKLPKYVVSATITDLAWRNSAVISGDVATEVTRLKALPGGELQVHGSPRLVRSLLADGLIDEFQLLIFPVVLGHGRRIFDDPGFAAAFRLAASATARSGIAVLTYLPAGKPRYGSFASDPEPERHRMLR